MLSYWLGIFFLSALGMFLYPVYEVDDSLLWPLILALGILFNTIGCFRRGFSDTPLSKQNLGLMLIPLAAGIFAFCFPYHLSFCLLGIGVILSFFPRKRLMISLGYGIILSGLVLGLQTACVIPYFKIAARYHAVSFLTPFFYWILKGLGITCAYSQETIFAQTPRAVLSLVTMWEKLGLYFFLTFLAGALVFIWCASTGEKRFLRLRKAGVLLMVLIAYSLIRYVFLSVIYIDIGKVEIFWKPLIVAGSYLPLPFLLSRFVRLNQGVKSPTLVLSCSGRGIWAGVASFFFFFGLAGYCWFADPGDLKKGRILFDEHYSNWEWSDRKLNTEWFGIQSVYNYYCFADYLNHFYTVKTLKEAVTDEILANHDIFIVKTPTTSFSEREIETIVTFVRKGGGLFLIGDHTNVFGTTININPLAERFGITFNYDATYDLSTSDLHFHEHNTLVKHPVVQEMPYFLFATSCSISSPLSAEDIIIASNLKTMYLDYSRGGFFPDKKKEKNYTFGLFLQSVGVKYGKGRVLAFSDSTCFSNFYMYIPGKPEYALGVINWLNRMNYYDKPIKVLFLFLMVFSLGFMVYLKFRTERDDQAHGSISRGMLLGGGILGLSAGSMLFAFLTQTTYVLPREHTPMKKIGFENQNCKFQIPAKHLLHNPSIDFHTFYVWTQRVGYVPTLFSLENSWDSFEMIVFINPESDFSKEKLKKIEEYVREGGRLLMIDHPKGKRSTAWQLLDRLGMKILYDQYQERVEIYEGSKSVGTVKSFAPIEGGEPLLFSEDRKSFISWVKRGKGMIVVTACSPSFTNKEMGETEDVPNEAQLFLYKLEFWILTGLMEGNFEPFLSFNF